jgi:hypothetical protein
LLLTANGLVFQLKAKSEFANGLVFQLKAKSEFEKWFMIKEFSQSLLCNQV